MGSGAMELGCADIGKCARQGLVLWIRSNGDDRVILKESIGSSAFSERLVYRDVQPVGPTLLTQHPLLKAKEFRIVAFHEQGL
jgi:hypothetical protein